MMTKLGKAPSSACAKPTANDLQAVINAWTVRRAKGESDKRIILEHKRVFAFDESEVGRINGYCYDMLFKVNKVIRHAPTRISPRDREACKEIIEKMVGKDNEPSIDPAINREQWVCEDPETRNKLSIVQRSEPSILKASASNSHEHMTLWHSLVRLHADLLEAFYQKIVTSPNHPGLVTPGSFAAMA